MRDVTDVWFGDNAAIDIEVIRESDAEIQEMKAQLEEMKKQLQEMKKDLNK